MRLFLAGDLMTGRGIDQILARPSDPVLHEPYVRSALDYVRMAERRDGPIPRRAPPEYVWGEARTELARLAPDARIVNLETSITTSDDWWRTKGIHYRMHPGNIGVLRALGVDVCTLANNHVLDWGRTGLRDTLHALEAAGMGAAGAGRDASEAARPAVVETPRGRVQVHAWGSPSAGVPASWEAGTERSGVSRLREGTADAAARVIDTVHAHREPGDRVVVSLHWGGNWGYDVPRDQRDVARELVDAGAADIVFGHSSHHPKGFEIYEGRLIVYGAGDFLNDYEGIGGREEFRGELVVLYVAELDPDGGLRRLILTPLRVRRFRLETPPPEDIDWLGGMLVRECGRLATTVRRLDGRFVVEQPA